MITAAIDNDILLKGAAFGLIFCFANACTSNPRQIGILGAAPFVVRKKLGKLRLQRNPTAALGEFDKFIQAVTALEPTDTEINYAAELEAAAQHANLPLDAGESQLCAIVACRSIAALITGDKRAIMALETVLHRCGKQQELAAKFVCLEQMALRLFPICGYTRLLTAVCNEPKMDSTLSICFSCTGAGATEANCTQGLNSYITAIRKTAPVILAP